MQPSSTRPTFSVPLTPTRRTYTGVDKLILAAYMEESAAAAAAAAAVAAVAASHQQQQQQQQQHHHHHHQLDHNGQFHASTTESSSSTSNQQFYQQQANHYMPSGRGIGYYATDSSTYAQIPTPTTKSELDLYHLLDRANLLNYFGTFLNFGGDDVQQLCDADEDEFLEIMSLVGMTQKPLHVRRLQKALVEWNENKETLAKMNITAHASCNNSNQQRSVFHSNSLPPMITDSSWNPQIASTPSSSTVVTSAPQQFSCAQSSPTPAAQYTVNTTINFNAGRLNLGGSSSNQVQQPLCHPLQISKPVPSPEQPLQSESSSRPSSRQKEAEQQEHEAEPQQQAMPYHPAPYEVFRGAPKRPRLMDDYHRKLLSQEHSLPLLNSSRASSTNPPSPISRSNRNALTPPQDDETSDEDDAQFEDEEEDELEES